MPESAAISAKGTLIYRNGTAIAEQKDITPPPMTRNTFDVSTQNSDDDDYIVGRRRRGDMSVQINFLPSGAVTHGPASGLIKAYMDGTKDRYNLVYPDGSNHMFSGFVTNIAAAAPQDGPLTANVTFRPTGGQSFV